MYVSIQNFGFNNAVKCFIADGVYTFTTRIHQFAEIQFILEGEVELTVDSKTEKLRAGDVIVISPFRAHSFKTTEGTKRWILIPSSNFISDFISNDLSLINGEFCGFTASHGLSSFIRENLFDMGDKVVDLEADKRLMLRVKALCYAILNEYTEKVPQTRREIKNNALASIIMYIAEHFRENITRESVGQELGYSPSYISHVIEDLPGTSFSQLLNSLRVEYAKKLLLEKNFNMLNVALECGFGSDRNFYRTFKALTGYSPKEYATLQFKRFEASYENTIKK